MDLSALSDPCSLRPLPAPLLPLLPQALRPLPHTEPGPGELGGEEGAESLLLKAVGSGVLQEGGLHKQLREFLLGPAGLQAALLKATAA